MRGAAAFVVVILSLAQTAAAAHFHPLPSAETYAAPGATADNGLCALCLVRFHSPLAFLIAPRPAAPFAERWSPRRPTHLAPRVAYRSHLFGRAPPASV